MEVDLKGLKPKIRYLDDMRGIFSDKEWVKNSPNFELYYMYGDLEEKGDLKYSITVIVPKILGKEFNKTKGHTHIGNFQETYTVLDGRAIYLLQKTKDETVEDVYAVKSKKGDSIIIPAGYGHVTINASNSDLKTGDWRHKDCKSDYSLFEKLKGACYYYTKEGWIKNENYKNVPQIRFEKPLKSLPKDLSFLKG